MSRTVGERELERFSNPTEEPGAGLRRRWRAFRKGAQHGWASPWDLAEGLSYGWPEGPESRAYDRGANLGQRLGRLALGARLLVRRWCA